MEFSSWVTLYVMSMRGPLVRCRFPHRSIVSTLFNRFLHKLIKSAWMIRCRHRLCKSEKSRWSNLQRWLWNNDGRFGRETAWNVQGTLQRIASHQPKENVLHLNFCRLVSMYVLAVGLLSYCYQIVVSLRPVQWKEWMCLVLPWFFRSEDVYENMN